MSLFRRFFVGAGYSLLGATVHRALLTLATILVARILGVTDYGIYVNLVAVVNLLMTVGLFGLNTGFTTFLPGAAGAGPERLRAVLTAGILLSCALLAVVLVAAWCGAGLAAAGLYRSVLSAAHLRIALPYVAALTLNTLLLAAVYGLQEFRGYSLAMMLLGLLVAAGSLIGVWTGGLRGLFIGSTVAYAISTLLVLLRLRRLLGGRLAAPWPEVRARARELLAFGLPTFLSGLFIAPAYWLGNMLMVRAGGPAPSGLFGVASSLSQLVLFIPATLATPLVPMLAEVAKTADRARFSAFVARNGRMVWCISLPVTVLVGGAAPVLIRMLYGAAFVRSVPAFVLLACANLLIAVESVGAYVFVARRRMWEGFALNTLWFLVVLLLMVPLVRFGHVGFALVLLLAYAFQGVALLVFLRRHLDLGPLAVRAGRAGLLTLGAFALTLGVALLGLPWPLVLALSVAGAALAAVLEWRFVLDTGDRALVTDTLGRVLRRGPAPA